MVDTARQLTQCGLLEWIARTMGTVGSAAGSEGPMDSRPKSVKRRRNDNWPTDSKWCFINDLRKLDDSCRRFAGSGHRPIPDAAGGGCLGRLFAPVRAARRPAGFGGEGGTNATRSGCLSEEHTQIPPSRREILR